MAQLRRVTFVLDSPDFTEPAEIVATVDSIPRTAEQLLFDGRTYRITLVLHNFDDATISVFGNEETS